MQNIVEILIALIIVASAIFLFIKNIKKKSSGGCDCGHCSQSTSCDSKDKNIKK